MKATVLYASWVMGLFAVSFTLQASAAVPATEVEVSWSTVVGPTTIYLSANGIEYNADHSISFSTLSRDLSIKTNLGVAVIHKGTIFSTNSGDCEKDQYCFDSGDANAPDIDVSFRIEKQSYKTGAESLEVSISGAIVQGISDVYNNPYGPLVDKKVNGVVHRFHPMGVYPDGTLSYAYSDAVVETPYGGVDRFVMQGQSILAHSVGFFHDGKISFLYLDQNVTLKKKDGSDLACREYHGVGFDEDGFATSAD